MVSKASELLPLPERPVTTTITSRGRETVMFFKLCSRAPWTAIALSAIFGCPLFESCSYEKVYGPHAGGQVHKTLLKFYHPLAECTESEPRPYSPSIQASTPKALKPRGADHEDPRP